MSVSDEAAAAADVFQRHRDELGFVNRAQCDDRDLVVVRRGGDVVAAALANHCVRKPQTTLYELAVLPQYRRRGLATELVERLTRETPHDKIIAKCPAELPANDFYADTGWERIDRETGKARPLNVWQLDVPDTPDIITTGRPDLTATAARYGWLRGSRLDELSKYEARDAPVEFVDMHWENPDRDSLLEACERHRPRYAVAGDYDGDNHETINEFGAELRQFVDNVIIVPHEPGEVERVPRWAVVGYSTPTKYAGTDAPIWEYRGRDVHILGGTVEQIEQIHGHLADSVVSIDMNSHHRGATRFAKWWGRSTPRWNRLAAPTASDENIEIAYEHSIANISYFLREKGVI